MDAYPHAATQAVNTDHALRYHDLRRNEYLRYFRGHSAAINSLCMSPKTDMLMSAAQVSVCGPAEACSRCASQAHVLKCLSGVRSA
jgi:hypothetical protein